MKNFCVSLTTLPTRIDKIGKTLKSIDNQSIKPNKIYINLPYEFKRFPNYKFTEDQIEKLQKYNVEINRCNDYGPGTKLIGSLSKIKEYDFVIILDDDHIYHNKMFEIFLNEFKKNEKNYSYYVQKIFNLNMGQGADGILINTKNLTKIVNFYQIYVNKNKNLFLNDDLWISIYLQFIEYNKIIDLSKEFRDVSKQNLVYKKHSNVDSLKDTIAKGFLNRRKIAKIEYIKFKIKNYFNNFNQR
tara:strand:+ start:744 stop:1472 length:729 start_codon:yes stop_codon:yes gene_type:complete